MKAPQILAVLILCGPATAKAATALSAGDAEFFEKKVRPVLVKHCYKCHSAESGESKGDLLLDTREGIRAGGGSGHAVVPGNPRESLLLEAVSYRNKDLQMPPKYRLEETVIADLEQWIRMGAPDPRDGGKADPVNWRDPAKAKEFWAFKPPVLPAVPAVRDVAWPKQDLDRFVLAELDKHGLKPGGDASRESLVRRAYFDLLGLPPSPRTVENFTRSTDPKAFERLLEMLLDSPSFGEKWGRHWLDVARYAESSGKEANISFPHAWRYRDYVIKSFNEDKPYDRFLTEQVAGDLLNPRNEAHRAELITATGFLALGPKSLNENNPLQFRMDLVDEQIDALSQAVLGVTVACARCHDHKFDPVSQREYYGLAGIFLSTDTYYGTVATAGNRRGSKLIDLPEDAVAAAGRPMGRAERERTERFLATQRDQQAKLLAEAREARAKGNEGDLGRVRQQLLRLTSTIGLTQARLDSVDENGAPKAFAMGVRDSRRPVNARRLDRGEVDQPKEFVNRGFVDVLTGEVAPRIPSDESGRLQLAAWLTTHHNPLTARVLVNRVWNWLFGRGIVETVDNFGVNGGRPTHPELLDHLAVSFVRNGWSVKRLVREIMLSRTYQLATTHDEANYVKDPDNKFFWRMTPRRLDAEEIRDAILAVSGALEFDPPQGSAVALAGDGFIGRSLNERTILNESGNYHRSIYLPVVRDLLPEVFNVFDFAEPSLVTGDRDTTTVPGQALFLMNSSFVVEQAGLTAKRIFDEQSSGLERINHLYLLTLGRKPNAREIDLATRYFEQFVPAARAEGRSAREAGSLALATFCQALMAGAEFRYLN